jgi:hypothetical protein
VTAHLLSEPLQRRYGRAATATPPLSPTQYAALAMLCDGRWRFDEEIMSRHTAVALASAGMTTRLTRGRARSQITDTGRVALTTRPRLVIPATRGRRM